MLGVARGTVFSMLKRGELVKVKLPGIRAWQVTIESIENKRATKGMSLAELSKKVVSLERKLNQVLSDKVHPSDPRSIDLVAAAEHDGETVRKVLMRNHPEHFN